MAKWYSEDPNYTEISIRDFELRKRIEEIMDQHTREMEGYSYYGSNPGISEDDYDEVAEDIMTELGLWEKKDVE